MEKKKSEHAEKGCYFWWDGLVACQAQASYTRNSFPVAACTHIMGQGRLFAWNGIVQRIILPYWSLFLPVTCH
jgi:hypothetical protein